MIYTGGDLSHIDRGVKFDSPYYYRVQACNYFGCADVSEAASASVPTPADQLALAEFIKQIAMDDFDWFGDRGTASSIDWDNDGITNPYDWTPTSVTIRGELVEVNLTLGIRGEAGTNFDPWPIYNVWQLQAIDGVSVSQTGEVSVNFELFGDEESRLNARYRLAMDIDATPTRQWDSESGFNPIGGSFGGRFDGRGNVVRGLFIDRADEEDVGLFADITNAGFLAVRDLGVEEADIRGERNVGIIAGSVIDADLLRVWSTGKVYGSDYYVGGVAGFFYANESDGKAGVRASWSAADVEGKAFVGGLVGQSFEVALQNAFSNNWSAGAVRGGKSAAGLVGGSTRTKYVASWTAGAVSGDSELAAFAGRGSANEYENAYWNANTSGVADSGAVGVVVQTLAADQLVSSLSDFGRSITVNAWDVGDSEFGVADNSADFPLLRAFSRPLQAVYLARALTRILPTGSTATVAAESGTTFRAGGIRLDTNGLADNDGADGTSTPTCVFNATTGVLQAAANYNGITVEMSMLTDADAALIALPGDATENCEVGIQNTLDSTKPFEAFDATLRLEISAPATLSYGARRLTVEQAVRIESLAAERALLEFVEQIGADDFNWFANTIDWDGDGITNPYDWTPTVGVNLLLDGADGSAQYPWPIYNVWQLQAIDGMSVSQDGEATRGLSFFGGDRLGEQYRLAVNIDATPTEQWDGGAGFDPIGGDFAGYLDGGGYAVRGLFINRAIPEVGLFGRIVKSGELAVSDLGLENANISGGNQTGILVGNLNANLAKVWTTGEVTGTVIGAGDDEESGVGGLAGVFATRQNAQGVTDSVILSWSAAQVSGDNKVGGLIGGNLLAHRSQLIDNWAGGNVSGGVTVGGFVGNPANAEFIRSWSAGEVSGSVTGGFAAGPGGNAVYSSVYWNDSSGQADSAGGVSVAVQTLVAANFGGDDASAAWDFGDSAFSGTDKVADFPFLKVHSQPLQAVNLANALTRILGVTDASTIAMATGMTLTADIIRIDTNRMAADERTDGTSSPDCSFDAATGVLRATTNYNGVTVDMRLLGSGDDRRLTISADSELDKCEIGVFSVDDALDATLRVETFAPAMGGDAARSLTTDYAFRLVLPPLSPEAAGRAAKLVFEAEIEAGDFDWFADDRENTSTAIDWDGDGIANPYDWTPTSVTVRSVLVGVSLTLGGAPDGLAGGTPWPIYNVWQLQAIDGLSVSETGVTASLAYFGAEASVALSLEYVLAVNIDATPTREWDKDGDSNPAGFNPIGGDDAFTGFLDGDGHAVRGLFINRTTDEVGLFGNITKTGGLAVSHLGVEDADIRGQTEVGIVVGDIKEASLRRVWTTGKVVGSGNRVGGLAGIFSTSTDMPVVEDASMNWSTADVRGGDNVGGAFGEFFSGNQILRPSDNWAAGDVSGNDNVAGFAGNVENSRFSRSWVGGAISSGGVVGGFVALAPGGFISYTNTYWNLDTSNGVTSSENQDSFGVASGVVVQTLAASDFGGEAEAAAWNFGNSDLGVGDDAADFPLLATLSQPWQAVNLARVLTRVFGVSGDTEVVVAAGETITADKIRIDTNGLAPNRRTDGTSSPSCSIVDIDGESVFRAETNYNSVTVDMRLLTRGNEKFIEAETPEEAANCEARIESRAGEFAAILRLEISAPAIGEDDAAQAARGLTVDYPVRITLTESTLDPVAAFIDEVESGDIDWFGDDSRIIGDGTTLDWDGDGINNPYDYTPTSVAIDGMTVGINLTAGFTGAGGTADNPWPIFNVWQLQAIDGVSVSHDGSSFGSSSIFGSGRLGANYRLATNIDASPTRRWGSAGFDPIGGSFNGFMDGDGYAVRGLFINRTSNNTGLFSNITGSGGLAVRNLGVEDADIRGGANTGIVAGRIINRDIRRVWTTGKVSGSSNVGGFSGNFSFGGMDGESTVALSWSTADVEGTALVGGLFAQVLGLFVSVNFDDNWAAGNVSGSSNVGGFNGNDNAAIHTRNWSAGAVSSTGDVDVGAFVGAAVLDRATYSSVYWNLDTSGVATSHGDSVNGSVVLQTLVAANFGTEAEAAAWNFGDSVLSDTDGVADFPLLKSHSRPWQAVNLAHALTRIVGVGAAADMVATAGTLITTDGFRLDTNGLADDERTDGTSAPICSFNNGVVRAQTNYNGVEIAFRLLTDGDERFVAAADNDCEVAFENATGRFEATLRLEISAPAIPDPDSSTPSLDNDPARFLVTDYALTIAPDPNVAARAILVREAAASGWFSDNLTVGASGTATDWDGDGIDNPYDWTPTSITVDGMTIGVNLTLEGAPDGTAGAPWPIYNVWQLQAINGLSVSDVGATLGGMTLFGDSEDARLAAQYILATDIDATQTKIWDGAKGFNPIGGGGAFTGFFDGNDKAVRNLFIARPSEDNVGLFGRIGKVSELAVRDLGVVDADISGGSTVGILAGEADSHLVNVWTTGKVDGGNDVGGLAGVFAGDSGSTNNTIMMSWSAAHVSGDNRVGGFIGKDTSIQTSEIVDSWAVGDVSGDEEVGGFAGLSGNLINTRNWSAGAVSGGATVGGFDTRSLAFPFDEYDSVYWNADTSEQTVSGGGDGVVVQTLIAANFGGNAAAAAWDFGDSDISNGDADFPLLKSANPPLQATYLARALTRILAVGDSTMAIAAGTTVTTNILRLDTNGRAPDERTDGTSSPTCAFDGGVLRAQTNYNGITIQLSLLASDAEMFVAGSNDCEVEFEGATGAFAATLRLEISAPATADDAARVLTTDYALNITPDVERLALAEFVRRIETTDFDWFAEDRIVEIGGSANDWDADGVANTYDWTPTSIPIDGVDVKVSLLLDGGDGSAGNPWPIYNVWQLQAIDGISVSQAGVTLGGMTLFGDDAATRLTAEYRLATNIDATQTKIWDSEKGFNPIGGGAFGDGFRGIFDGRGYAVRNLFINRTDDSVGLFARIAAIPDGGGFVREDVLAVSDLGVEDADIRGGGRVGILAGFSDNVDVHRVWTTGKVVGTGARVGGVFGQFATDSFLAFPGIRLKGELLMSWSTADVEGSESVGGFTGDDSGGGDGNDANDNWVAGNVKGGNRVAGFSGSIGGSNYTRNWSAGAVSGNAVVGGFAAHNFESAIPYDYSYWNFDTSGVEISEGNSANNGAVVQALTDSDFGGEAESAAWNFGDSDLSDGDGDFPLLAVHSQPWQAVNLARALTRVLRVNDFGAVAVATGTRIHTDLLRLDTNGLAANERADGTSAPSCSLDDDGVLRAQTNYNDITVELSLLTDGDQSFVAASNNCEVEFANAAEEFAATLRLEISAPAIGADAARSLTTDYALRIAPDLPADALAKFVAEIEEGDFDWFGDRGTANSLDWDNDGIENPYDWTPTSVAIDGEPIEVNLTLNAPDGLPRNPWLLFNVWQLQAIDGVSVSQNGEMGTSDIFGDRATRLRAEYRLATNIDATPTENWDSKKGFDPIGGKDNAFTGFFDGRGYAVRNLFIDRASGGDEILNVGLFARIDTDGRLGVMDLGVEDADIRGGGSGSGFGGVGILAGEAEAGFHRVWTTGKVFGSGAVVGGVIGLFNSTNRGAVPVTIMMSWSTADVEGGSIVGGLTGQSADGGNTNVISNDNWAAGNVSGKGEFAGGFAAGYTAQSNLFRNWSAGVVSGASGVGGFAGDDFEFDTNRVLENNYWNLDTSAQTDSAIGDGVVLQTLVASNFGGNAESAAWDFGDSDISDDDADFPLLVDVSRPWQAVNLARVLTRFLAVSDAATITAMAGMTVTTSILRLDTNGLAADERTDGTSTPTCSFNDGVLRAETNYNGVTVDLSLLTGGNQRFVEAANCEAAIRSAAVEFAATLRLEISAPAIGDDAARVLTTDYAMQITLTASTRPALDIVAPSEAITVAANASAGVKVLTVTVTGGGNPSFASKNNGDLQTEGGVSVATISLATAATAAFDSDGLILSLTLTVTNDGGDTETAEVRFVSAPRGINPDPIVKLYASGEARGTLLVKGESKLSIWHHDESEIYTTPPGPFVVFSDSDEVQISGNLADGIYDFELILFADNYPVTATLSVQVIVAAALAIEAIPDPVTVAANAAIGDAVLTLSLSGGVNAQFSSRTGENFENTGRSEKTTVSLARAATVAFHSDGITLDYVVRAISEGDAATITARFVSAPLLVNPGSRGVALLAADAVNGGEVLAAGASGLVILHNGGGALMYSLQGGDSALFTVNAANGRIVVEAASLPQDIYDFELLLADAALELTATLELQVNVIESAADEAVRIFLEEIDSGARKWRGEGIPDDWDNDGTANPYDWTPTSVTVVGLDEAVLVNLNRNNADGSTGNPYPIYNVWQLQAIDGVVVSQAGGESISNALFGASRLSRHYRLAINIDATPTDLWSGGFNPIGDTFTGSFDGEGREIRGLYVNPASGNGALFILVGTGGRVSRLGVPDVDVRVSGSRAAGVVADLSGGAVSLVWATGSVQGGTFNNAGLVAFLQSGEVRESWFTGDINGRGGNGGLIGLNGGSGTIVNNWVMADVRDSIANQPNGGLVGRSNGGVLTASWSGGPVENSTQAGGLVGGGSTHALSGGANYLDNSTSGLAGVLTPEPLLNGYDVETFAVETMVTLTLATEEWDHAVWNFGDIDLSDGAADYPFLRRFDALRPGLQAVAFANFQSENLIVTTLDVGGESPLDIGVSVTLSLGDTNGLAPDGGPTPTRAACEAGATEVELNYNNVTVKLQTIGDGLATFTADCEIVIRFADSVTVGYFSVSALIASQKTTMSRWSHSFELPTLIDPLPTETNIVVPADAAAGYEFLTVTLILGGLAQDENGQAPVVGLIDKPPTILTIVGEARVNPDDPVTTVTSTITLSAPTRVSVVDVTQEGLVGKFLLPDGATTLFASDDEVFALTLAVTVGDRVWTPDYVLSLRSAPLVRVATPSPVTATITQGRVGATVLQPGEAGLAIWHNFGAAETYSPQPGSNFGVDETTGLATIVTALSASETYELAVELTDGTETATREFRFVVDGEQPAEQATLVVLNTRRPAPDEVVMTLAWREVEYADRYTLSRANGSAADGAYQSIYEGDGEQVALCLTESDCDFWLTYTESDLTIGSVYYYRLDSCNDFGCAGTSEVLSVSVSSPLPNVFDAAPTGKATLESSVFELAPGFVAAFVEWDVLLTAATVTAANGDTAAVTTSLPYRYILSRASSSGGSYKQVNTQFPGSKTTRRLSYYDPNAARNDVYYYRLVACNDVGCGPRSDILTLTVTLTPKETEDLVAPETLMARANPVAKAAAILMTIDGVVTLAPSAVVVSNPVLIWSPVLGAMRYRIFRALGDAETLTEPLANGAQEYHLPDGDYEVIDTVIGVSVDIADCGGNVVCPAGAKKFTDPAELTLEVPSLTLQKAYYYQVAACNAEDCGPVSDPVRVGGPVPPGPTPTGVPEIVVEEFRVDDSNNNLVEADLSWNEVTGANRYRLLRAQIGGGYEAVYEADVSYFPTDVLSDDVEFIRSQGNSFTDTDLSPGEIYFYRAQGCSGSNCGEVSDAVTLRLLRPGRAKALFDESGSSRAVVSTLGTVFAVSSITVAWEETPNADYHYVLRGGTHRDDVFVTLSHPAVTITAVGGETSYSVTLTLFDGGGYEVIDSDDPRYNPAPGDDRRQFIFIAPVATATITQSFTITATAGEIVTRSVPIPVFGTAYMENLDGDDIRHYQVRACNALGCGELSDAVVVGGGLLGIEAADDDRTVISITINLDGSTTTMAIDDTLNEILKTPTNVGVSLCQAGDPGRTTPRAVVNWDIRDTGINDKRFYRISRSRFADGASAELVILSPGGAPGVGEIEDFDDSIRGDFSSVAFYYGVQECSRLRLNSLGVLDEDSQICSAPAVAITSPVSAFPNCDDGSIPPPPQVNENLDQVTIRADLSEARITAAAIRFDAGREYVVASVAFVVKWDATPGAVYYLVTRESRNLYTGESESAEFAVEEGETVYEDIMSASSDVVNIYRVQACDRVDGCGPQSDPLELIAPSPAATPPLFVPSPVISVGFIDPFYAVDIKIAGALLANRYVLSRAPMPDPSDDQTLVYTDLDESGEAFEFTDGVIAGMQYFYRTRACNALGCATSEEVLISVGPPGPPPVAQTPAPDATQNVIGDVSRVEFELELPLLELQVELQWDAVANAEIYILTRAETESGPATEIYRGRERTHFDDNVEFAADYHYRLQACNDEGCASTSEPASISLVTRLVGQTPAPTATKNGDLPQVNVQWDAVANAQTYILSRRAESSGFSVVIYRGEEPTYIDKNVEIGGGYFYRLQACNAASCASVSDSSELFVLN